MAAGMVTMKRAVFCSHYGHCASVSVLLLCLLLFVFANFFLPLIISLVSSVSDELFKFLIIYLDGY